MGIIKHSCVLNSRRRQKNLRKTLLSTLKMGDSDDDVDYKRRDKFRSERRGYDGGGGPPGGGRREYRDARPGPPGGYQRNYGGGGDRGSNRRRDNYSPPRRHNDMSPPNKRMRGNDWEDRYDRGGYDRYEYDRPAPRSYGNRGRGSTSTNNEDVDGVQPVMMSFKAFLATQDDSISDEEAIKKYAEYKLEFKRQQLNEFFVTHKDEEWFKLKYHPEDSVKRKDECKAALEKRIDVFSRFLDEARFKGITIDGDQSDVLVKLLDSVVIFLEGGTDFDLEILDQEQVDKTEEKKEESKESSDIVKEPKKEDEKTSTETGKKEESTSERKRHSTDSSNSSDDNDEEEVPPPG